MKYIILLTMLTSCGWANRAFQQVTGKPSSVCHNGISYLQFASGVSVEYETFDYGNKELNELVIPQVKRCRE
jgi:hypothetical protein